MGYVRSNGRRPALGRELNDAEFADRIRYENMAAGLSAGGFLTPADQAWFDTHAYVELQPPDDPVVWEPAPGTGGLVLVNAAGNFAPAIPLYQQSEAEKLAYLLAAYPAAPVNVYADLAYLDPNGDAQPRLTDTGRQAMQILADAGAAQAVSNVATFADVTVDALLESSNAVVRSDFPVLTYEHADGRVPTDEVTRRRVTPPDRAGADRVPGAVAGDDGFFSSTGAKLALAAAGLFFLPKLLGGRRG